MRFPIDMPTNPIQGQERIMVAENDISAPTSVSIDDLRDYIVGYQPAPPDSSIELTDLEPTYVVSALTDTTIGIKSTVTAPSLGEIVLPSLLADKAVTVIIAQGSYDVKIDLVNYSAGDTVFLFFDFATLTWTVNTTVQPIIPDLSDVSVDFMNDTLEAIVISDPIYRIAQVYTLGDLVFVNNPTYKDVIGLYEVIGISGSESILNNLALGTQLNIVRVDGGGVYHSQYDGVNLSSLEFIDIKSHSGFSINPDNIILDKQYTDIEAEALLVGTFFYNSDQLSWCVKTSADTYQNIGEEVTPTMKNNDTTTHVNGTAVYVSGGTGKRAVVKRALANAELTSYSIAIATQDVLSTGNKLGRYCSFGSVNGVPISNVIQTGESDTLWVEGAVLWLSSTDAGKMTTVRPTAPNHAVRIGYIVDKSGANISIFVTIDTGHELSELHDVDLTESKTTPIDADNLLLQDSEDSSIWKKLSIANIKTWLSTIYAKLSGGNTFTGTQVMSNDVEVGGVLSLPSKNYPNFSGKIKDVLTGWYMNGTTAFGFIVSNVNVGYFWATGLKILRTDEATDTTGSINTDGGIRAAKNILGNNVSERRLEITTSTTPYQMVVGVQGCIWLLGTAAQPINLPIATTLIENMDYEFVNLSSATASIRDAGGNLLASLGSGQRMMFKIVDNATSNGTWMKTIKYDIAGVGIESGYSYIEELESLRTALYNNAFTYTLEQTAPTLTANRSIVWANDSGIPRLTKSIGDMHGFDSPPNASNFTISNTGSSVTVNLLSNAGNYKINGTQYTNAGLSITFTAVLGQNFICINSSGLVISPIDILDLTKIPCATVNWDGTTAILADELHTSGRNLAMHKMEHDTDGARWVSGFVTSFASGATNTFSTALGELRDEDRYHQIGARTEGMILYRNAALTAMIADAASTRFAKLVGTTTGAPYYDNAGTLTALGTSQYGVYYMFATNRKLPTNSEIVFVMGQGTYSSVANAQAAPNPTLSGMSVAEWKSLYRVIVRNVGGSLSFIQADDLRAVTTGLAVGGSTTITKALIESVLTGEITSHTHPYNPTQVTDAGNSGTLTVAPNSVKVFTTAFVTGDTLTIQATAPSAVTVPQEATFVFSIGATLPTSLTVAVSAGTLTYMGKSAPTLEINKTYTYSGFWVSTSVFQVWWSKSV